MRVPRGTIGKVFERLFGSISGQILGGTFEVPLRNISKGYLEWIQESICRSFEEILAAFFLWKPPRGFCRNPWINFWMSNVVRNLVKNLKNFLKEFHGEFLNFWRYYLTSTNISSEEYFGGTFIGILGRILREIYKFMSFIEFLEEFLK